MVREADLFICKNDTMDWEIFSDGEPEIPFDPDDDDE